jgi:hypothetical protein
MTTEEMKQFLKDHLHIHAEMEDGCYNFICITLSLGTEVISETKLWI